MGWFEVCCSEWCQKGGTLTCCTNQYDRYIYPIEVRCEPTAEKSPSATQSAIPNKADVDPSPSPVQFAKSTSINPVCRRSTRISANQAWDRVLGCAITNWHWCRTVPRSTGRNVLLFMFKFADYPLLRYFNITASHNKNWCCCVLADSLNKLSWVSFTANFIGPA